MIDTSRFMSLYNSDPEFREFIDEGANNNEILMEFAYDLYMKYGEAVLEKTQGIVNHSILNINKVIDYFQENDEFEKCQNLVEIKNKL